MGKKNLKLKQDCKNVENSDVLAEKIDQRLEDIRDMSNDINAVVAEMKHVAYEFEDIQGGGKNKLVKSSLAQAGLGDKSSLAQAGLGDKSSLAQADLEDLANQKVCRDEDVSLGKFKNAEQLLKAYNALEGEFTKRCQRLKEVLAEVANLKQAQADITAKPSKNDENDTQSEIITQKLAALQGTNNEILEEHIDNQTQSVENLSKSQKNGQENVDFDKDIAPLAARQIDDFVQKKAENVGFSQENDNSNVIRQDFLRLMDDEEFIDSIITFNPRIKTKIIEGYLRALDGSKPATVMANGCGRTTLQPQARPRSLEEARRLASLLLN